MLKKKKMHLLATNICRAIVSSANISLVCTEKRSAPEFRHVKSRPLDAYFNMQSFGRFDFLES